LNIEKCKIHETSKSLKFQNYFATFSSFGVYLMKYLQDDQQLIQQCIDKQAQAQKEFYMRFSSKMYGVCLRYLKNEADAKDLMHDGFMMVFDKLHLFKGGNLGAWMSRIFANLAITKIRKKKRGPVFSEMDENLNVNQEEDIDVQIDPKIELATVMQAMNKLSDKYRTILNLYAIDKLSHKEIAEMLDISVGTSKSQLSRARVMLKDLIEKK